MKYQHCVLLPFALILIGAGLVTLLLFGIRNLRPYAHTKDFHTATCSVMDTNISDPVTCVSHDGARQVLHSSSFPCLRILVNYTEEAIQMDAYGYEIVQEPSVQDPDDNETDTVSYSSLVTSPDLQSAQANPKRYVTRQRVFLYHGYSSWQPQRSGGSNSTCSVHVCNEDYDKNEEKVESVQEQIGEVGHRFKCFFNPRNHTEVYAEVVSGNTLLHALVWPALGIGFGLFLLVVVAFLSCEVWICRNPKRVQRQMEGQTYELASYRENLRESKQRGWRSEADKQRSTGDGNNNSRLPRFSAAADIVRKWSFRGRRSGEPSDTSRTSRSFGGVPSRQWSITKADTHFCTT